MKEPNTQFVQRSRYFHFLSLTFDNIVNMEDDEFWNTSDVKSKALNFEDDEPASQQFSKLGAEIRAGLNENSAFDARSYANSQNLIPLNNLISEKALENILLADSGQLLPGSNKVDSDAETSVPITLRRIFIGRSCNLTHHKSLKSKTELLDGAIAVGDGNAILAVILFLVQTLKKKLVHQILASRPVAVNHYISYLAIRLKTNEVNDLLTMLGRSSDAAIKQYQMIMEFSSGSTDSLLNKLKNLLSNHFSQPSVEPIQVKMLNDYIKLIEWQKCMGIQEILNKSVLQCLAYCCINHWSEGAGKVGAPQTICQQQQISQLQYDWTALSTQAVLKNWELLETIFIKKNFLGKVTLSCSVPLPRIIGRLHELGANTMLLKLYLNHISSVSQRLELAAKYKAHNTVIDCFVLQKDKQALTQYKMTLHPQSEEYFYAENVLRTTNIKWKN